MRRHATGPKQFTAHGYRVTCWKSTDCLIGLLGDHMVNHLEIGHTPISRAQPQKLRKGHDFAALKAHKRTIIRKTPR